MKGIQWPFSVSLGTIFYFFTYYLVWGELHSPVRGSFLSACQVHIYNASLHSNEREPATLHVSECASVEHNTDQQILLTMPTMTT